MLGILSKHCGFLAQMQLVFENWFNKNFMWPNKICSDKKGSTAGIERATFTLLVNRSTEPNLTTTVLLAYVYEKEYTCMITLILSNWL
jgi:hypothetical protein